MKRRNFVAQHDQMDCGPSCLAMISSYYGKDFELNDLREKCYINREGVSLLAIDNAAKKIGFDTYAAQLSIDNLDKDLLPCILHWNQNHFVVLYKVLINPFTKKRIYRIADPNYGFAQINEEKFNKGWLQDTSTGIALFLKPTEIFYDQISNTVKPISLRSLLGYLRTYIRQIWILFILLLFGTCTMFLFPILTQRLIDNGVSKKDINLIGYILLAQLVLFFSNIVIDVIRNWITLSVGTKINIQIISDFLNKILKLPVRFFETKMMGDFYQRIQDHERIEVFLTSQSLLTFFSIISFSVFFGILLYYDYMILFVYISLTVISIIWSLYWLKKRKLLDYLRFRQKSENQESIYEIIKGVSELKLNQFEKIKLDEWKAKQQRLYELQMRMLRVDQIQLSGFEFFNQIKNILVTFLAAYLVVNEKMTLGALLSVSYIIGQMNGPVNQLVSFFRSLQDARLSLARLYDVQHQKEEEQSDLKPLSLNIGKSSSSDGITLNNVSFQYEGPKSPFVLKNLNFSIPEGKITAIVGASGSGKSTLMKILLRFYDPTDGIISYKGDDIISISPESIRVNSGIVMQDGFIFSDTIARNITTGDETINDEKLIQSVKIANIKSFIDDLPLGFDTKIGSIGNGISGGQKQRILIARAVYKNPHYIFFDEATSALDAENEKIIHDNLQLFFKGKTVVIIAHRLSTVKNADQIIVLKNGAVVEQGNHNDLVHCKGEYFNLVKNQLELGI
ncbi:TPA: peptidase domain-containing ABC transporter [Elizabethkingia anophelis]